MNSSNNKYRKIFVYGWLCPLLLVLGASTVTILAGCEGGFIDTAMSCKKDFIFVNFFQLIVVIGLPYLYLSTVPYLIVLALSFTSKKAPLEQSSAQVSPREGVVDNR